MSRRTVALSANTALIPGPKLDGELAVERVGDAEEGVDSRRPAAALESRDRGLRGAAELRQLLLREADGGTSFRHLPGDLCEEPALIGMGELATELFEGQVPRPLAVSHVCYIADML